MNKAIIVDLDGTLALLNGRNPYDASTADKDELNTIVADVVKFFSKDYKVVIMSGRHKENQDVTEKWLEKYDIPYDSLLMRPNDDKRSAPELKKELLIELLDKYDIKLALDDMWRNCEMFRSFDIPAWQVNSDPYKKSETKDQAVLEKIGLGDIFDKKGKNPDNEEVGVIRKNHSPIA